MFVNYPHGHAAGRPFNPMDQYIMVRSGLTELETIQEPDDIVDLGLRWSGDDSWKMQTMRADGKDARSSRDTTAQWQYLKDRSGTAW